MATQRITVGFVTIAVSAWLGVGAEAGNNRSVVSTTGVDTNNCSVPAPCRSLAAALAATNANGEVIVLDSGGYGPASITNPVTITAPVGIRASVFQSTANPGLIINTTGNVTIKGLSLLGGGSGTTGIDVKAVGLLSLDNIEVQDFVDTALLFEASSAAHLVVTNSAFRNCFNGLFLSSLGSDAYIKGSQFVHNGQQGVAVLAGSAVIVDSFASQNKFSGFSAAGASASLELFHADAAFNSSGYAATTGATLHFGYSLVSGNPTGFDTDATIFGSFPGTSLIQGTQTGTFSSVSFQ